jgi:hypothetical protein
MTHVSSSRSCRSGAGLLAVGALLAVVATARVAAAAERETLAAIIARWNAYKEQFMARPREDRVRETKQFFNTIPWADLEYLCREGSPGVGPDSTDVMRFVMTYRLEVGPPPVPELAAFLANPDYTVACRFPVLVWSFQHRDSLSAEERRVLGAAHLTAGAYPGLPDYFQEQFYLGAVALVASDSLMGGMMAWARSGDEKLAARGVRMMASSCDPRRPDSLAALAAEYFAARSPVLDVMLVQCRKGCAERALPVFVAAAAHPRTPEQRVSALEAMAQVPTREAAAALLAQYGDGGTVADSTFATVGERRAHYYGLWLATRLAEPHLLAWLREGSAEDAALAVELLDRALRFGPPDKDDEVVAALGAWAARAPATETARARAVQARAENPPQKGAPRVGGASPEADKAGPAGGGLGAENPSATDSTRPPRSSLTRPPGT